MLTRRARSQGQMHECAKGRVMDIIDVQTSTNTHTYYLYHSAFATHASTRPLCSTWAHHDQDLALTTEAALQHGGQ